MENKNRNLWLMRFNEQYGFNVIKDILNKQVNVSLITGNSVTLDLLNKLNIEYPKDFEFVDNNEICALNFKDEKKTNLKNHSSLFLNNKFYKSYYIALQVMERNQRFLGDLSFEERNYAIYKQVEFWKKKIEEKKPSNIIFFDIPHTYYEQILMAICEEKKIPCLLIKETNTGKSAFLNNKFQPISGYGGNRFSKISKEYFDMVNKNQSRKEDIALNNDPVTFKFFLKHLKYIFKFLKNLNQKYKKGYYIKTDYYKFGFNSYAHESFRKCIYAWNCIKYRSLYKKLSSEANFERDYVYMPLVSGYEAAFHPVASPLNTFIILDYLLSIIPENCYIYVKEHPAQFRFRHHQLYSRSKEFYYKIKEMKRVKFIDIDEDHYKLILKSRFVVGSSIGSSAVQSAALKKDFRYYGFHFISDDHIKPLFNKSNKDIDLDDPSSFHEEWSGRNLSSDPESLANKIMLWVDDN
jgi:hypothetical protein